MGTGIVMAVHLVNTGTAVISVNIQMRLRSRIDYGAYCHGHGGAHSHHNTCHGSFSVDEGEKETQHEKSEEGPSNGTGKCDARLENSAQLADHEGQGEGDEAVGGGDAFGDIGSRSSGKFAELVLQQVVPGDRRQRVETGRQSGQGAREDTGCEEARNLRTRKARGHN